MTNSINAVTVFDSSDSNFSAEVEQSSIPVFVDFWSSACAPCKALHPVFEALAETYQGQIKFVKADLGENKEVAQRLGVRQVPTLVLFRNGEIVERILGGRHKAFFTSILDKYAQQAAAVTDRASRCFSAFHGDVGLRDAAAERVRTQIEAGRVVWSAESSKSTRGPGQQRYTLMGAAAETDDDQAFETALGIPASVGHLEEAVHSLLLRPDGDQASKGFVIDPPRDCWPVDWWLAIPPGVDLRSLPSHFLHWLLQSLVDDGNPLRLDLPDDVQLALRSLARLHARVAQAGSPTAGEWHTVRAALGTALRSMRSDDLCLADRMAFDMFERTVEQLAWPADELDEALAGAIVPMYFMAIQVSRPEPFTEEQWGEHRRIVAELEERADRARESLSIASSDMTPEQVNRQRKELDALEEVKAIEAFREKYRPVLEAHVAKVSSAFVEYLHAGLMLALSATVSSTSR